MIQAKLKTVERKTTISREQVRAAWAEVLGLPDDNKTTRPSSKTSKKGSAIKKD